jgi:alcohol dehydrogenase
MRAVLYDGFGEPLRIEPVRDPEPPPHGAVIRVEATGLCRSDWHGWMGHDPDITAFPHVPGHELAGTVQAVGPDVRRHRPGDRVTVPFVCACGTCDQCVRGNHQVCDRQRQPGFTHWGSFAELVAIDWADVNLVTLPDHLDATAAASLGCRFATAYRAVAQVGRVRPGEWVAVHGCGGVGLSAVMIAAAAGARVVGVDVSPAALELAEEVGAERVVPAGDAEAVREATDGGAHLSLDALGAAATAVASLLSLRKRGRHVQVGVVPEPARLPLHRVMGWELELLGSHGLAAHAYPALLDLVARGMLQPSRLVRSTIRLDEAPAALTALGEGSPVGVTVIDPRPRTTEP